jgi:hypothetical protein
MNADEIGATCNKLENIRNAYKIVVENFLGYKKFGSFRCTYYDNTETDLGKIGCEDVDRNK